MPLFSPCAPCCDPCSGVCTGDYGVGSSAVAHFDGGLITNINLYGCSSRPFMNGSGNVPPSQGNGLYNNLLPFGDYPSAAIAIPAAIYGSFDAVCIKAGVRFRFWSQVNFSGNLKIDMIGPRIMINSNWSFGGVCGPLSICPGPEATCCCYSPTNMYTDSTWNTGSFKLEAV